MWHRISIKEELIGKILDRIPNSLKKEYDVESYAHDYAYRQKYGTIRIGDDKLVKEGVKEVYRKIGKRF